MSELEKEVEKLLKEGYQDITTRSITKFIKKIIDSTDLNNKQKIDLIVTLYDVTYQAGYDDGYDEAIWFYEEECQ